MNTSTNYAAIFYSNTNNDLEILQKNVNDFPASSVARFLLLCHHKKNNDPAFQELAKQTALFLNNPSWSEYQLWQLDNPEINSGQKNSEDELAASVNEEIMEIPSSEIAPSIEENKEALSGKINDEEQLPASVKEEIIPLPSDEIEPDNDEKLLAEMDDKQQSRTSASQEIIENSSSETTPPFEEDKEVFAEKINDEEQLPTSVNEEITENSVAEIIHAEQEDEESYVEKTNTEEELPASVKEEIIEIPSEESTPVIVENEEYSLAEVKEEGLLPSVKEEIIEIPSSELVAGAVENKGTELENDETLKEVEIEPSEEEGKNIRSENRQISEGEKHDEDKSVLEIKVPEESGNSFNENSNQDEEENQAVTFEPLHTVDYFASQGIKINEEALANDHLVKQVKSFTAWLKSMKKLHPGQLPEQNEVIEKIIQASSESSNKDANVLTEAMAEVLIKQGKREKALEMYQKLSLINPSKSAYFAAKIENLKSI